MTPLKVETFNVYGLLSCVEDVASLWEDHNLCALALTETWLQPEKSLPLCWRHESVRLTEQAGTRRMGGVTLLTRPGARYQTLQRVATDLYQADVVAVGDLHIAGVYVSPRSTQADLHKPARTTCVGVQWALASLVTGTRATAHGISAQTALAKSSTAGPPNTVCLSKPHGHQRLCSDVGLVRLTS